MCDCKNNCKCFRGPRGKKGEPGLCLRGPTGEKVI